MHLIPTVITNDGSGERAYGIYSRLLRERGRGSWTRYRQPRVWHITQCRKLRSAAKV